MTTLMELIGTDHAARQAADNRRYAELLAANAGTAKALEEIKALMERLGKTPDAVREDAKTIQRLLDGQRMIRDGTGLEKPTDEAQAAVKSHDEETREIIETRRRRRHELQSEADRFGQLYMSGQRGVNEVNNLRRANPALRAHVAAADVQDLA